MKQLGDSLSNEVKSCAGAAGEDEAFHGLTKNLVQFIRANPTLIPCTLADH